MHALKGLTLLRASRYGEIALAGSCRMCSTLAAAPVLSEHVFVTVVKNANSFSIHMKEQRSGVTANTLCVIVSKV